MKKIFSKIAILGFFVQIHAIPNPASFADMEPEVFVQTLVHNVQNTSICFFRLPLWAQVRYVGFSVLGAATGNLIGFGAYNLFSKRSNMNEVNFWHLQDWTTTAWIGTIFGLAISEYFMRHAEFPNYKIRNIDQNLLTITITYAANDSETLLLAIKRHFAARPFALVDAFKGLEYMYSTFTSALNIFKAVKKKNIVDGALISQLIFALDNVESALLVIKNDPNYQEEQKNYTIMQTQQGLKQSNQIQMGALAIDLAHAVKQ